MAGTTVRYMQVLQSTTKTVEIMRTFQASFVPRISDTVIIQKTKLEVIDVVYDVAENCIYVAVRLLRPKGV